VAKRNEQQLKLSEESEEYALKPLSDVGSGKAHDPEKKRLSEIIDTLNDLFGSEVNDEDQLHFAQGVADRIRRDERTTILQIPPFLIIQEVKYLLISKRP
jgi:type I restriction enzyme R subunit